MAGRVAIMLDGGFVTTRLRARLGRHAQARDVVSLVAELMTRPRLVGLDLLRAYFYDAPPLRGVTQNPLDGSPYDFGRHETARRNREIQAALGAEPDLEMRMGELLLIGWKLRHPVIEELKSRPRSLTGNDFAPEIEQKGVDLRIGLDVAWLSIKRIVDVIVLVSADSDLVPAMEFARHEGLKVYLEPLGHGVRAALREHSDYVFPPA